MGKVTLALVSSCSICALEPVAHASDDTETPRIELRHDLLLDGVVTTGLAAGLITWTAGIKPNLSAPSCVICDGEGGKVNAIDDFFRSNLRRPSSSPAGGLSDILAYGVAPLTGVGFALLAPAYDHRSDEAPLDMLLIVEATLSFAALQQGLATLLPRERPGPHAETGADRESSLARHSSLESFPAGHSGSAFAVAAAGGTVATMRGYRLAPLVWITGGMIALVTSYLRIAADRHYFTDVTAGGALGIATGISIPLFFHSPAKERPSAVSRFLRGAHVSTTEIPGGRMVGVAFGF